MGTVGFGELAFWLATQRRPEPGEVRVFEAVWSRWPTMASRRPRSDPADLPLRAGLDPGRAGRRPARGRIPVPRRHRGHGGFLHDASPHDIVPTAEAGWDAVATHVVRRSAGPGGSCRAWAIACTSRATRAPRGSSSWPATRAVRAASRPVRCDRPGRAEVLGKPLPLNGAGVCGAALADLGLPIELLRGFALLARGRAARPARRGAPAPRRQGRLPLGRPPTARRPRPLPSDRIGGHPMPLVTEDNITELAGSGGAPHGTRGRGGAHRAGPPPADFAREVRLTEAEWIAAMRWLTPGQISDEKREEFILASDVFGLCMLVVQLNHRFDAARPPPRCSAPSTSTAPRPRSAGDMSDGLQARRSSSAGRCAHLRNPLGGAVLDVWQADADGPYEAQLPSTRRGCGRSTPPATTAATASAPSPPRATRSRWTGRWVT